MSLEVLIESIRAAMQRREVAWCQSCETVVKLDGDYCATCDRDPHVLPDGIDDEEDAG